MAHRVAAIIAAAGSGDRLGVGTPKALVDLGNHSLVDHAVSLFDPLAEQIIICAPTSHMQALAEQYATNSKVAVVAGGSSRSLSVRNAISALSRNIDFVLIHDAARALASADLVGRVVAELRRGADGVIPVLPVSDTIKEVLGDKVVRTVDRSSMQRVQTPQGFRVAVITDAHAAAKRDGVEGTDDASLVERIGIKVNTVAGEERAFKITTPFDLQIARSLMGTP